MTLVPSSRELVEAAIDRGIAVGPPQPNLHYTSFCDPAADRMTALLAASRTMTKVQRCSTLLSRSRLRSIRKLPRVTSRLCSRVTTSERPQPTATPPTGWSARSLATASRWSHSERDRSEIYLDVLPLFTAGKAQLIDNPRLAQQFYSLERRTFPTGKDASTTAPVLMTIVATVQRARWWLRWSGSPSSSARGCWPPPRYRLLTRELTPPYTGALASSARDFPMNQPI